MIRPLTPALDKGSLNSYTSISSSVNLKYSCITPILYVWINKDISTDTGQYKLVYNCSPLQTDMTYMLFYYRPLLFQLISSSEY